MRESSSDIRTLGWLVLVLGASGCMQANESSMRQPADMALDANPDATVGADARTAEPDDAPFPTWTSIQATCVDESGWKLTLVFGWGASAACTWDGVNGRQLVVQLDYADVPSEALATYAVDAANSYVLHDQLYADAAAGDLQLEVKALDLFDEEALRALPRSVGAHGRLSIRMTADTEASDVEGDFEAVACPPWRGMVIAAPVCEVFP